MLKSLSATELQELEAELQEKQHKFEAELKEMKTKVSDEEYKRLIAEHKMELREMQEKLELQRQRQRQEMLDKLAARKKLRNKPGEVGEIYQYLPSKLPYFFEGNHTGFAGGKCLACPHCVPAK